MTPRSHTWEVDPIDLLEMDSLSNFVSMITNNDVVSSAGLLSISFECMGE